MSYDVVIVGASVAGCTAATYYGRAGLRVAVVERHSRMDAHKALCGHFILGGAEPTLRRMGFWDPMLERGGVPVTTTAWSSAGWTLEPGTGVPRCISLPRSELDPLLRGIAADTPGVDLLLGRKVDGLLEEDGRVRGVRVRRDGTGGGSEEIRGRLVVGADGVRSTVAELAGVSTGTQPNGRFMFWAYYEQARAVSREVSQIWLLDPDVVVAFPTSGGRTQLGAFPARPHLDEFRRDPAAAIERRVRAMPNAPDLSSARRVSKVIGTTNYPCRRRDPTPRPGLALVGDAAIASDPVPAVGCGWAFRTAEALASCTTGPLLDGDPTPGLAAYHRAHRFFRQHDRMVRMDTGAGPANPVQRLVRTAAVHDREVARKMYLYAVQATSAAGLADAGLMVRAPWAALRGSLGVRRARG